VYLSFPRPTGVLPISKLALLVRNLGRSGNPVFVINTPNTKGHMDSCLEKPSKKNLEYRI